MFLMPGLVSADLSLLIFSVHHPLEVDDLKVHFKYAILVTRDVNTFLIQLCNSVQEKDNM